MLSMKLARSWVKSYLRWKNVLEVKVKLVDDHQTQRDQPSKSGERENGHIKGNTNQGQHPERKAKIFNVGDVHNFATLVNLIFFKNLRSPLVEICQNTCTDKGHDTRPRSEQQGITQTRVADKMLVNIIVNRYHGQEIGRAANTSYAQLQAKHHVQFLVLEPTDSVRILSDGQRFSSDSKTKTKEQ